MLWQWNMSNNSIDCLSVYKGHERNIESLSVSPDKHLFMTGGWDTMLKVWSTADDAMGDDNGETQSKRSRKDGKSVTRVIL